MNLMSIISMLEQEVDVADEKMVEEYPSKYYDGYGDGLLYAISLLKEYALNDCKQRITELEFSKEQNLQNSFMFSKLDIPSMGI